MWTETLNREVFLRVYKLKRGPIEWHNLNAWKEVKVSHFIDIYKTIDHSTNHSDDVL